MYSQKPGAEILPELIVCGRSILKIEVSYKKLNFLDKISWYFKLTQETKTLKTVFHKLKARKYRVGVY
jgi:hypothetical protein